MRTLLTLYRKDIESLRLGLLLTTAAVVGWDLYLYHRLRTWPGELVLALSLMPLGFVFLWVLWQSVQVYRHEWQSNGIYTILSIPQPGWKVALAKLLAVLTAFSLQAIVATAGSVLIFRRAAAMEFGLRTLEVPPGILADPLLLRWLTRLLVLTFISYWMAGLAAGLLSQTAYVISRLTRRFRFLLFSATFIVAGWLTIRISAIGARVLSWMPSLTVDLPVAQAALQPHALGLPEMPERISLVIRSGPLMGLLLGLGLLLAVTSWVIQEVVEA